MYYNKALVFRKQSLITIPFFLMIICAFMIPSDGNHGILSIKSLTFLSSMGAIGLYAFIKQTYQLAHLKFALFLMGSVAFLIAWLGISTWYDETTANSQSDQFKLFLITSLIPITSLYLISENIITPPQIYRTVIYASFSYALFKVIIIALHLTGIVNVWNLLSSLGIRYMRMSIYGGLDRLQTSVDIATPFIVFFVLQGKRLALKLPKGFPFLYFVICLLSTFLSFSRYLLFVYFVSWILYWLTLERWSFVKLSLVMVMALVSAYIAIGPDKVAVIVERRLFSKDNTKSDDIRISQIHAIANQFEHNPLFGTGVGGYAPESVRDKEMLHLYEVQWFAFLMQFGIIGISILLAPLLYIGYRLLRIKFTRVSLSFFGLFMLWLLSGLTNPFLISLTSGIMYTLFYISPDALTRPNSSVGRAAHS